MMKWISAICMLGLLAGCSNNTAVSHGSNTALDGADLIEMTDDMSMKILASAPVQKELASKGALKVVVQPVENRMTGEVLPKGAATAFTARLRTLLADKAPDQFTWVMNKEAWWSLRDREIERGPDPSRIQPEYALTARFSTITQESSKHRSTYYLCAYVLTDLNSGKTLWTDKYELKKAVVKGFLD